MPEEAATKAAESELLKKLSNSPFTTVTGPLGFASIILFWQMSSISTDIDHVTKAVTEVRVQIVSIEARLKAIETNADTRDKLIDQVTRDINDLRSRVDRHQANEALHAPHEPPSRKRRQ